MATIDQIRTDLTAVQQTLNTVVTGLDKVATDLATLSTAPVPTAGPGPAATSNFLTVDFGAPVGKYASPYMWGVAAAVPNDYNFRMCGDTSFLDAAAKIMPSLYRINSNSGGGGSYWSDQLFASGVNSPNWSLFDTFLKNAYRFISPTCRLVIGMRWNAMTAANYAIACRQLVQHIKTVPSGDGKLLPLYGIEVGNEDDKATAISAYCNYFNAAADAVHQVDPNIKMIGPVDSWMHTDRMQGMAAYSGNRVGALCYHAYAYCKAADPVPTTTGMLTSARPGNDAKNARAAVAGTVLANTPLFLGEYNMECGAQSEPRQQQIAGAVFAAQWMLNSHFATSGFEMGALWEMANDTDYGIIQTAKGYAIAPVGWLIGKAGATMGGTEVNKTWTATGNRNCLAVTNGTHIGVMIVNYDTINSLNGQVALSKWPVNGTGIGQINRWQISNTNPSGSTFPMNVTGGVTELIMCPPMSVTILYN